MSEELARRGELVIWRNTNTAGVHLTREGMGWREEEDDQVTLSADDLRWLITTGGPAALDAITRSNGCTT